MGKDPESYPATKGKSRSSSNYCGCFAMVLLLLMIAACLAMVMYMFFEMQKMKEKIDSTEIHNGDWTKTKNTNDNEKDDIIYQKLMEMEAKVTLLELSNMRQTRIIQELRKLVYKVMSVATDTEFKTDISELFENTINKTALREKRDVNDNPAGAEVESVSITGCLQGPAGPPGRDGRDGRDGLIGQGISAQEVQKMLTTFKESLQKTDQGPHNKDNPSTPNATTGGSVYIRWGRKVCPSSADLVYDGVAGGSHYTHTGGGSEKICLPRVPQWGKYVDGFQSNSYVYGAEYELYANNPFSYLNAGGLNTVHDQDVPCAVCYTPSRPTHVMIPAWKECPADWTKEYNGYLMAAYYAHQRSSFNCMDEAPEVIQGGQTSHNGALFYNVEAQCGSLPCPNYVSGRELTCVVCTK